MLIGPNEEKFKEPSYMFDPRRHSHTGGKGASEIFSSELNSPKTAATIDRKEVLEKKETTKIMRPSTAKR